MGIESLLTAIFVIIVLGYACYLLFKHVQIASPFREIAIFLIVILVILWLLSFTGIWHGPVNFGR